MQKKSVAFKSTDFESMYFVAAQTQSESFGSSIGIWATNRLESGMIFSANTDAAIITVFPDGQKSGPKIKTTDHGYNEVIECFNNKYNAK